MQVAMLMRMTPQRTVTKDLRTTEDKDPDWGGTATGRRAGRRGRGRGKDAISYQRGGGKGKVSLARRLTYAASVFKSGAVLDTGAKKGIHDATKSTTFISQRQLQPQGTDDNSVVQGEGKPLSVSGVTVCASGQNNNGIPLTNNVEPVQSKTKTEIVLPPKRRVSEIEKEAALLSTKPPENMVIE